MCDPSLRTPIASYDVNEQDAVWRRYILNGPYQPYAYKYPTKNIYGRDYHFSILWLHKYSWLEYSVEKDATFCMVCYLFGKGSNTFVKVGWRNWNIGVEALDKHMGDVTSAHKKAQEKCNLFVQGKIIDNVIVTVSQDSLHLYKTRFIYSLRCLRFLLHQGLACRRHDENEESKNKGNFLELLNWLAGNNEEVDKVVLKNAPANCTLTSPKIQKQIIGCCSEETSNRIIEELGDDHYAIFLS
jgi:hypothetical protein